jgi:hypothetical protein
VKDWEITAVMLTAAALAVTSAQAQSPPITIEYTFYRVETYNSPWTYSWTYARTAALRDHQIQLEPRVSRSAAR